MAESNRRSHPRQLRRVQVRFQRQGEERTYHGFTKNLSLSGALITAPDPPPRGSRLRIELRGKEHSPVVYGVVVHAHRVPPELRRFADSAMGVRFLGTDELVAPFLPAGEFRTVSEPLREEAAAGGTARSGPAGGATVASPGPTPPPDTLEPQAAAAGPVFTVDFPTVDRFLTTFRRDLVNGGLFVPTPKPARLYETVTVVLQLPEPEARRVQVGARVVQVIDPQPGSDGPTTGGMGLEVLDTDRLLAELRPVVERLKR